MDRTNISIAGPAIRGELRLDDIHLGWVFSAFLMGYAAFQILGGWLAYRYGPRLVLASGVLWWGVFTALTALPQCAHGARTRPVDPDPVCPRRRGGRHLSSLQPVCRTMDSGGRTRPRKRLDFCGRGDRRGLEHSGSHLDQLPLWMARFLLVQRRRRAGGGPGLVCHRARHPGGTSSRFQRGAGLYSGYAHNWGGTTGGDSWLLGCGDRQPQRGGADVELLHLRLRGVDLLQLVLHLYGASARAEPEGQRAGFDDSIYRHDRLLPGRRPGQRLDFQTHRPALGARRDRRCVVCAHCRVPGGGQRRCAARMRPVSFSPEAQARCIFLKVRSGR